MNALRNSSQLKQVEQHLYQLKEVLHEQEFELMFERRCGKMIGSSVQMLHLWPMRTSRNLCQNLELRSPLTLGSLGETWDWKLGVYACINFFFALMGIEFDYSNEY